MTAFFVILNGWIAKLSCQGVSIWINLNKSMTFKINCLLPCNSVNGKIIQIIVHPTHTIQQLLSSVGLQYHLIYKGSILLPSFTVSFYNINAGDCLVAVPKNCPNQINFYKKNTQINPMFLQQFTGTNAVSNEIEKYKMFDNSQLFVDLKPKAYRKAVKKYNEIMDKKESRPLPITETIYYKPDKPCSEPLPKFWLKP